MAKDWVPVTIVTETKGKKTKAMVVPTATINNSTKETKKTKKFTIPKRSQSYEELQKEGEELYFIQKAQEDRLIDLYKEKKLTNKNTIKEAQRILKARKAAKKKEGRKSEKTEATPA